ncbi:MAG: methylamine utilization protein MauE [Proteobacteria bacterium]|jgi:uncharacterized membrane protein|nr:methylamine utilization protein MauE [Pseudomonadota bacterium]
MSLDPVVTHLVAAALAMLLLIGAWQKLRDQLAFRTALEAYDIVPANSLSALAAWLLPCAEVLAAVALVVDRTRGYGVALAALLLCVVTAAVIVNLLRGRTDLGCGCGGIEDEQTLSWALVARNGVLLLLLAVVAMEPAARDLNGLDYLTVAAGACALYGLYAMVNQLLANQPRLARLRTLA